MEQKINGIAYWDEGRREGLPVVFIHGFPFNHLMWKPQVEEFLRDYRVISYDVRGHGKSDVGDGQYSIELFTGDLFMLLDHLKIEKAVLCGLSMGGYIALRAAEKNPDRIKALVLCDTKSASDTEEAKVKRAVAAVNVKKIGSASFAVEFLKSVLSEEALKNRPELVRSVTGWIAGNSSVSIAGTLLALAARTDTTAVLSKLSKPVLFLVGEKDTLTPVSVSEAMQKLVPQAHLHVIPGAAHLSNLENPSAFNNYLSMFLKKIS